jgi:hypothetical protein
MWQNFFLQIDCFVELSEKDNVEIAQAISEISIITHSPLRITAAELVKTAIFGVTTATSSTN